MKILITGGVGYCGVMLASSLLDEGHEVTVVDNFLYGYDSILHLVAHPNLHVVKTDIRNSDLAYLAEPDVVYHLAAISGFPACAANPNSAYLINVEATRRIAENLSPDQLLIYASTTSFYGSTGSVGTEDCEVSPVSVYGITKYQAEEIVMARDNSISLRWATVFGASPRMRAGLLVNDFVERAVSERVIVLYDADSKRSFMHVSDLVRGYLFALEHQGEMRGGIYNMGSDRLNYSKLEIAEKIQRMHPCEIVMAKIGDTDIRHFVISYEKARALGFDCLTSLEDGIAELVKLFQFYTPNSFIRPI